MKKLLPLILFIFFFSFTALIPSDLQASHRNRDGGVSSATRRAISNLDDDKVKYFPAPILFDVPPSKVRDTWGEARSQGRSHEGTDIFAPRGAFVVSPTAAVVTSVVKEDKDNRNTLGGNYVYTANPGGERFYYAHLDGFAPGLKVGSVLKKGDLIGYVGNTGNASGGTPHLHFGIYKDGPSNPYPRLTKEFSLKDRMKAVDRIIDKEDDDEDKEKLGRELLGKYRSYFVQAKTEKIELPDVIKDLLEEEMKLWKTQIPPRVLSLGMQGDDVAWMQRFLISQNKGPFAQTLSFTGATGFFGEYTKNALIEYQIAVGIVPVSGIFDGPTKGYILSN